MPSEPHYAPVNVDFGDVYVSADTSKFRKQGHSCCGGCCDMRRAVIIVNIVKVTLLGISSILLLFGVHALEELYESDATEIVYGSDEIIKESEKELITSILINTIETISFLCGAWGAIKFDPNLVLIGGIGYVFMVLRTLTFGSLWVTFPDLLLNGFLLYPHVFLYKELKEGIMTPTNYDMEKQSCCCYNE